MPRNGTEAGGFGDLCVALVTGLRVASPSGLLLFDQKPREDALTWCTKEYVKIALFVCDWRLDVPLLQFRRNG